MTTVVRWNPIREPVSLNNVVERWIDEVRNNTQMNTRSSIHLALDVYETDDSYTIVTALSGVNPDGLNISLHDNVLNISGEVHEPEVDDNTRIHLQERHFGTFNRSLKLANVVDVDAVNANFENGILTLTLPKVPEAQPRAIPVTVKNAKNH